LIINNLILIKLLTGPYLRGVKNGRNIDVTVMKRCSHPLITYGVNLTETHNQII